MPIQYLRFEFEILFSEHSLKRLEMKQGTIMRKARPFRKGINVDSLQIKSAKSLILKQEFKIVIWEEVQDDVLELEVHSQRYLYDFEGLFD